MSFFDSIGDFFGDIGDSLSEGFEDLTDFGAETLDKTAPDFILDLFGGDGEGAMDFHKDVVGFSSGLPSGNLTQSLDTIGERFGEAKDLYAQWPQDIAKTVDKTTPGWWQDLFAFGGQDTADYQNHIANNIATGGLGALQLDYKGSRQDHYAGGEQVSGASSSDSLKQTGSSLGISAAILAVIFGGSYLASGGSAAGEGAGAAGQGTAQGTAQASEEAAKKAAEEAAKQAAKQAAEEAPKSLFEQFTDKVSSEYTKFKDGSALEKAQQISGYIEDINDFLPDNEFEKEKAGAPVDFDFTQQLMANSRNAAARALTG